MEIPVLIEYGVQYLNPAGRTQSKRVHEVVEFEVAEASESDAPVAVSWNDIPSDIQAENWGPYLTGVDAHTRWYADSHWRPLLAADFVGVSDASLPVTVDGLRNLPSSKTPYHSLLGNLYGSAPTVPRRLTFGNPEYHLGTMIKTQRSEAVKVVQDKLKRLLVVGDDVYIKCAEPKIVPFVVVQDAVTKHRFVRIVTSEIEITRAVASDPDNVYPVTAFDEAMLSKHLFTLPAVTAIDRLRRPEIHLWDSVDEDTALNEVADVKVRKFVMELSAFRFGEASCEQLESMAEIRRAFALRNGEERFERLEQALRACVVAWEGRYEDIESLTMLADTISSRQLEVPFAPSSPGTSRP
jgi:hypothetical protein